MNWPGYTTWPGYHQAVHDSRVSKSDLVIFDTLRWELTFGTFQECKRSWISSVTGIRREHVRRAIKRLCLFGYLEMNAEANPRQYRLVYYNQGGPNLVPSRAA